MILQSLRYRQTRYQQKRYGNVLFNIIRTRNCVCTHTYIRVFESRVVFREETENESGRYRPRYVPCDKKITFLYFKPTACLLIFAFITFTSATTGPDCPTLRSLSIIRYQTERKPMKSHNQRAPPVVTEPLRLPRDFSRPFCPNLVLTVCRSVADFSHGNDPATYHTTERRSFKSSCVNDGRARRPSLCVLVADRVQRASDWSEPVLVGVSNSSQGKGTGKELKKCINKKYERAHAHIRVYTRALGGFRIPENV